MIKRKKLLASLLIFSIMSMCFVSVNAATTTTLPLNQDFSTFTTQNQSDLFDQKDNIDDTAEAWTPVKGVFGKKNDDTAFLFTSEKTGTVTSKGPLVQWDFASNTIA